MNHGAPLISVVIPAYNASEFIEECLNSITSQSLVDFEAIVVDDGSTDATASIVDNFVKKDNRFILVGTRNKGVSHARNKGIDMARGQYITFVDSDDALHPRAFEKMVASLEKHGAGVVIVGFRQGRKVEWEPEENGARKERVFSYEEAMEEALYQKKLLNSPWGAMMKRELLEPGIRFREGVRYEDLDAFYRFYEHAGRIVYNSRPYYFYRENPGSFINRWSEARLDVLDVTDRLVAFFSEKYPSLAAAALDRRFSARYNMLLLLLKHEPGRSDRIGECLGFVKEGRLRALKDPKVRLKNKLGALASYGGLPLLRLLSRL